MIERKFISQKIKEGRVQEFVASQLTRAGHNKIEIKRTPLGERIIIHTSRPGLIVGRKGENIRKLTTMLKKRFDMENPQIEVSEIENLFLDANSVAERISGTFERFGPKRFKFTGYDTLSKIMKEGALGAEIVISGRGVPGSRSKTWRFSSGYLKKSGNIVETGVRKAKVTANLKSGSIGIKVSIMPPDIELPDKIVIKKTAEEILIEGVEKAKESKEVEEKKLEEGKVTEKKEDVKEDKKEEVEESKDGDNKKE